MTAAVQDTPTGFEQDFDVITSPKSVVIADQDAAHRAELAAEVLQLIESDDVSRELWQRWEAMSVAEREQLLAIARRLP